MRFKTEIMSQFAQYQLPVIGLAAETPPEAVCTVFEKVNTGGVTLTTFELVTAMFAGHGFKLREDWESRRRLLHDQFDVLRGIGGEHFLQTVTLLTTQAAKRQAQGAGVAPERVPGVKCKKHDVLRLKVSEYEEWADLVQIGYEEAAKFLHRQFVFTQNNVPYGTNRWLPSRARMARPRATCPPTRVRQVIGAHRSCRRPTPIKCRDYRTIK